MASMRQRFLDCNGSRRAAHRLLYTMFHYNSLKMQTTNRLCACSVRENLGVLVRLFRPPECEHSHQRDERGDERQQSRRQADGRWKRRHYSKLLIARLPKRLTVPPSLILQKVFAESWC